ncbi:thiazolylpeptide-type bacteriocin [Streptomyces lincolnensis]|uniref:thiazolylpeptide-type bacteriocin n=1 Tax=Streptomyces lincolnensis TaxID=1915 RepID=UPI0037D97A3C
MANKPLLTDLAEEILALETENFEIKDYADAGEAMLDSTSTTSCSTTSSTTSTTSCS